MPAAIVRADPSTGSSAGMSFIIMNVHVNYLPEEEKKKLCNLRFRMHTVRSQNAYVRINCQLWNASDGKVGYVHWLIDQSIFCSSLNRFFWFQHQHNHNEIGRHPVCYRLSNVEYGIILFDNCKWIVL